MKTIRKDNTIFLKHILESIDHIEQFIKNKSKNDFKNSVQLQDAIIRRIEIIGEAAKNMDESFKEANKNVEWKNIAGMRDVIIHKYFGVDLELVWNVIIEDLPKLKKEIKKILSS
jgi:uncharacterized protein with HEPN domain